MAGALEEMVMVVDPAERWVGHKRLRDAVSIHKLVAVLGACALVGM